MMHEEASGSSYKIIKQLTKSQCGRLAPFMKEDCLDSYLLSTTSWYTEGTLHPSINIAIYGLFNIPTLGESVFPLKIF